MLVFVMKNGLALGSSSVKFLSECQLLHVLQPCLVHQSRVTHAFRLEFC